ncbi:MAG: hypothetical protein U0995_08915 [Erythrobacter sp.]|nr:hypothetical protein [Erythrobacter sp.]MDZ4272962.1 hypothetical protein [Erythrobacter sp.]MDZ4276146.1 hypothetical protein [Erythrobacter sp.]
MIWYSPVGFPGLRCTLLSRSALAMIVIHVMPPSLAEAIRSGRFPA